MVKITVAVISSVGAVLVGSYYLAAKLAGKMSAAVNPNNHRYEDMNDCDDTDNCEDCDYKYECENYESE